MLSPVKFSSGIDFDDDHTLPAYSPATDSAYVGFAKDKIGQKITSVPYEPPTPSHDSVTGHSRYAASSISSAVSSPFISISDEYPPPSPPAPLVSLPVPAYHRPFSPPTFYPAPTSAPRGSGSDSLRVTIDTRVEVERMV